LHNSTPDLIVVLPPRYISLPHLIVNNNIKIKGSPGTLVEINNGIVLIKNPKTKLSISECSFVFNIETKSFIEKYKSDENLKTHIKNSGGKYYIPLIKSMYSSSIEINDCDFRTIIHEDENIIEESDPNRKIFDTCISIPKNKGAYESQLSLQSTIFSNFSEVIQASDCSLVNIDNCHFSDIISTAVSLCNIQSLTFVNSLVNNTNLGLEIIVNNSKKNDSFTNQSEKNLIRILNNEFNRNNKNALKITSENDSFNYVTNLELCNNTFAQNKSCSISIEKLLVKKMEIIENQIKSNFETGLVINNVKFQKMSNNDYVNKFEESFCKMITTENNVVDHKTFNPSNLTYNDFNFVCIKNQFYENKNNYSCIISGCDSLRILIDDCKFLYNLNGLGLNNLSNGLVLLKNSTLNDNLDCGMTASNNSANTKIFFLNTKLNKNASYGLNLSNTSSSGGSGITSTVFYIKNSEIFNNKSGGIYFKNVFVNLDYTKVNDNTNWAIEIPVESNKYMIKLINYENQLNNYINNPIGGQWGTIANKKSICANGGCSIL
jgi:hypothetical protein